MAEAIVVGGTLGMGGAIAAIATALWFWANAVARKHAAARFYQRARWLPRVGTVLLVVSMLVTVIALVVSFHEIANAETSSEATQLARGISTALNLCAAPGVLGMLCLASSAIVSLAGTMQRASQQGR